MLEYGGNYEDRFDGEVEEVDETLEDFDAEVETEEPDGEDGSDERTEPDEGETISSSEETEEDDDEAVDNDTDGEEEESEEYEEIPLADYIDDSLIPPDSFKNQKEEAKWYKEKYTELLTFYNKEDFVKDFVKEYEQQLISKEQNVEKYKAVAELFDQDPVKAVKLFAPQFLVQNGYDAAFTEDEKYDYVDKSLKSQFGEDYANVYKEIDANNPNTISGKMYKYQQEILNKLEERETKLKESIQNIKPVTQKDIEQAIELQYEDFKESYTKEEYIKFVNKFREKAKDYKLKDYHKLVYFDQYIEDAYNKGMADGKKNQTKSILNIKKKISQPKESTKINTINKSDRQIPFYLRNT